MPNLPRFFAQPNSIHRGKFSIYEPDSIKKIRQVLRLSKGDRIRVFDGEGNEYTSELEVIKKNEVKGRVLDKLENTDLHKSSKYIIIAQSLTRTTKIDQVVRMNSEIGINEFVFFESNHSIVKLKDFKENKLDRWEKIALESTRQSEQNTIPIINPPIAFVDLLDVDVDVKILLHSRDDSRSVNIKDLINEDLIGKKILIIIGPEGGFSENELTLANDKKVKLCHLDLPILRTETAGLVVGSHLMLA